MAAIMKAIAVSLIVNKIKTTASPCFIWADQNHGAARNTQCETCTQWRRTIMKAIAASLIVNKIKTTTATPTTPSNETPTTASPTSGHMTTSHTKIKTTASPTSGPTTETPTTPINETPTTASPTSGHTTTSHTMSSRKVAAVTWCGHHFTIKYQLRLAQICGKIPQAWSTWAAVTCCGHIHMHIHSI